MTTLLGTAEIGFLGREMILDCSDLPLELLADSTERLRLSSWRPLVLRHPDLWFDGRWHEPPDDWRNDRFLPRLAGRR